MVIGPRIVVGCTLAEGRDGGSEGGSEGGGSGGSDGDGGNSGVPSPDGPGFKGCGVDDELGNMDTGIGDVGAS